jgi:hypothetical protein
VAKPGASELRHCPTSGGSTLQWGKDCPNERKEGGQVGASTRLPPPDFGLWWSVSGEYELTYRVQDSS